METQNFPSRLLADAVAELSKLPGVGEKTALRLALHILRQEPEAAEKLGKAITHMRRDIKRCKSCNNISDADYCTICANPTRTQDWVCVVEDASDVMAIEQTGQYQGIYHVLGGIISPMDGVGPGDLEIGLLDEKISQGRVSELIIALSTTMEGDTTGYYLYKRFRGKGVKITQLARGVSFGDEIEYADTVTLGKSIANRVEYKA